MSSLVKEKSTILDYISSSLAPAEGRAEAVSAINAKGRKNAEEFAFPTRKHEEWRFTDLRSVSRNQFVTPAEAGTKAVGDISDFYLPEAQNTRLVLINGVFDAKLSSISDLPEQVIVGSLAEYASTDIVKQHLGKYSNYDEDKDIFAALNDADFEDGAFIYIPVEVKVESPIHILNVTTDADKPFFVSPRILFVGERYSQATIVEEHIGLAENVYLTVPLAEFKLFEGANVHHARIQRDSKQASHISRPIANIDQHSEYHSYTICLGAKLFRNDPRVIQNAEEVDFTVDALVLIDGDQIADTHSIMDHRRAHARSHQLHKVVVNGNAHSIFNGKIFVARDAQKIDSFQENRNLLLSRDGKVNTKPQLEIFADDVLCSHGATIGQLSDEEVFYLQSRGLTEQKARELLVYAFTLESIENMKVESVHKLLLDEVIKYTRREAELAEMA